MTPSRLSVWVLHRLTSTAIAQAILGDVAESLACQQSKGRVAHPRWWIERETWKYILAFTAEAVRRCGAFVRMAGRDGWRALRASPRTAFFIFAILTAAISTATVTFSVVDAVVLRPLPYSHPQSLVVITGDPGGRNFSNGRVSASEFLLWHDRSTSFDQLAATRGPSLLDVGGAGAPAPVQAMYVTSDLFTLLGLQPFRGRLLSGDDERAGSERVAVISHALWVQRFGSDPGVINTLAGSGQAAIRIVGVLPPKFSYPAHLPVRTDVWMPLIFSAGERTLTSPGIMRGYDVIGRLKSGVTREAAQLEVRAVSEELLRARPEAYAAWHVDVRSMRDALVGDVKPIMMLALWAVFLVTAIGCVNAANIALSRATVRAREFALRSALGASRRTLIAGMLVEGLILSSMASVCALIIALWAVEAARAALPEGIALTASIGLNGRVYLFGLIAAFATGLGFVAVPAWQASRADLVTAIKAGAMTSTPERRRWRSAFLASQLALVTVLLIASALVGVSFVRILRTDLGFQRQGLVSASAVGVPGSAAELEAAFGAIPGVTAVGLMAGGSPPLVGLGASTTTLSRSDAPDQPALPAELRRVTSRYFEAAAVPIREGRTFDASDVADQHAVVLDERSAAALFGSSTALGKRLRVAGGKTDYVVVGIASNVRMGGPEGTTGPQVYLPATGRSSFNVIMRTTGNPAPVMAAAQAIITGASPGMAAYSPVVSLDEQFARLTATRRSSAMVMIVFGALALIIGLAGVYGVISGIVTAQMREFGVRIALGARASQVARVVLSRTVQFAAVGAAAGMPVAAFLARAFQSSLFNTDPLEPAIYATVVGLLTIAACAAAWAPARRASRVDPITILKTD